MTSDQDLRPEDCLPEDRPMDHGDVYDGGDHRKFVGGKWAEIGRLQFDFLVAQGLKPEHVLVDVACGSLRGGVWFIPYLDAGNYLGIEAEAALLERGAEAELSPGLRAAKRPELVASRLFAFERFGKRPDYGIAQSLFTHLNPHDIGRCLRKLKAHAGDHPVRFYVTFQRVKRPRKNPDLSHAQRYFAYTVQEMKRFGRAAGFAGRHLGEWGHPRGQEMYLYTSSGARRRFGFGNIFL